jgi:hypothetical protein
MREVRRRRSHVDEVTIARQRILAALEDLDIDFSSSVWRSSQEETIQTLASVRIDWELFFCERTFRAHAHPSLAPTYKWLAACWLTGCGGDVRGYSIATVRGRLYAVRQALHSLQVDADSLSTLTPRQIQSAVCALYNVSEQAALTRASQTMRVTLEALHDLHRLRRFLPSALACDPFPPSFVRSLLARARPPDPWSAPAEPVCLELIRQAIRMIGTPADEVIRLREKYVLACEAAKRPYGRNIKRIVRHARASLLGERFSVLPGESDPWTHLSAETPVSVKLLVAALEGACAVILLFLSGPRVSELRRASAGSVRHIVHANGIAYPYFFAHRSKRGFGRKGGAASKVRSSCIERGWILGDTGVRALDVLRRLSRIPRRLSRIDSYWLTVHSPGLWTLTPKTPITIAPAGILNRHLNEFARLVRLSERTGWNGRLHSHMGRKACARFIAKRDRSALADLAIQFGHLSPYVTDACYGQPDSEYRRLIDEELSGQMQEVATELAGLDAPATYTNLDAAQLEVIRDRAVRFLGEMRSTLDVRRLLTAGVRLVPCDWGMCIYRQETSLCEGTRDGPSADRRSPTVCRRCLNFVATAKHLPFWRRRVGDCQRALSHRGLPEQTKRLVEVRLAEAQDVVKTIQQGTSK